MAKFNEILVGRYNRYLQKLFGLKGGPPAPQLSSEVQPGFQLFSGEENRFLENWKLYSVMAVIGPTVGQIEAFQIKNPPNSNMITVVEQIAIWSDGTVGGIYDLSWNFLDQASLTNAGAAVSLDNRQGAITGSQMVISTSAGGAVDLALLLRTIKVPANDTRELLVTEDQQIPMLPQTTLRIRQSAANSTTGIYLSWRERFLEEPERT